MRTKLSAAARTLMVAGVAGLISIQTLSVNAHPLPTPHYHLAQQNISLKQAVEIVQKSQGGEVLKAEASEVQGRAVYRVRLMSNGRVREFMVDAASGELVKP